MAPGERLGFLSEGAFFGEIPLLCEMAGSEIRNRTIKAVTDCELCYLTKGTVRNLQTKYPELDVRIRRFSRTKGRINIKKIEHLIRRNHPGAKYQLPVELTQLLTEKEESPNTMETRRDALFPGTQQASGSSIDGAPQTSIESTSNDGQSQGAELREQMQALTSVVCDIVWKVDELVAGEARRQLQLERVFEGLSAPG